MPFTPDDYNPHDFANRRHIGPSPPSVGRLTAGPFFFFAHGSSTGAPTARRATSAFW